MKIEIENFLWKLKMFFRRNFKRSYLDLGAVNLG